MAPLEALYGRYTIYFFIFFLSKYQSGHLYATFTTSAEMGSDIKGILHVRERERLDFFMETAEASLDSACLENGAYFILFHFKVISVEPRLLSSHIHIIYIYIYIYI